MLFQSAFEPPFITPYPCSLAWFQMCDIMSSRLKNTLSVKGIRGIQT